MFEDLGVFQRESEGADAVRKEMYDFDDKGGRRIALRPEGTASVVRAFVEHHPLTPWKVWYATPAFRYENVQAGRYRQHHQVGLEVLGSADPDVDVEVIALGCEFLRALGLERFDLLLNSMGTVDDRARYVEVLRDWLRERKRRPRRRRPGEGRDPSRCGCSTPSAEPPGRSPSTRPGSRTTSPTRAGRTSSGCRSGSGPCTSRSSSSPAWCGGSTTTRTRRSSSCPARSTTRRPRSSAAVATTASSRSSAVSRRRASGSAPASSACSSPATPRACSRRRASRLDVFVVDVVDGSHARDLTTELRAAGIRCDRAFDGRAMRSQMKAADRSGAAARAHRGRAGGGRRRGVRAPPAGGLRRWRAADRSPRPGHRPRRQDPGDQAA